MSINVYESASLIWNGAPGMYTIVVDVSVFIHQKYFPLTLLWHCSLHKNKSTTRRDHPSTPKPAPYKATKINFIILLHDLNNYPLYRKAFYKTNKVENAWTSLSLSLTTGLSIEYICVCIVEDREQHRRYCEINYYVKEKKFLMK